MVLDMAVFAVSSIPDSIASSLHLRRDITYEVQQGFGESPITAVQT
jgi:hypothetical protein